MAKMCPMCTAGNKNELCIHEKMILGLVVLAFLYFTAVSLGLI